VNSGGRQHPVGRSALSPPFDRTGIPESSDRLATAHTSGSAHPGRPSPLPALPHRRISDVPTANPVYSAHLAVAAQSQGVAR
jgi:hypothetical protein